MIDLINIQSRLKAPKDKTNSFGKYKYRSCESILEAVKPLLKEHNCTLTLSDESKEICGIPVVIVTATFTDSEGKQVICKAEAGVDLNKKGMDTSQTFGASSSYARKYALNGLFLIDDTKDADTDEYHNQQGQTQQEKESLTDERFNTALRAVAEGNYSKEKLLTEFNLTAQQRALAEGM